jgi:hypothetical protein
LMNRGDPTTGAIMVAILLFWRRRARNIIA